MKIFFISDFHENFNVLDKLILKIKETSPDMIVFSGDVVSGYARGEAWFDCLFTGEKPEINNNEIDEEVSHDKIVYNNFFSALNNIQIPVFIVPGNMDAPFSNLLNEINSFPNINMVHGKVIAFENYSISGFGGEITEDASESNFVNVYSRHNVEDFFLKQDFKDKKCIFIFHTPPISEVDKDQNRHKGSIIINEVIEKIKPEVCFCGHAHYAKGKDYIGNTLLLNPGALNSNNYGILNIETKEIIFNEFK